MSSVAAQTVPSPSGVGLTPGPSDPKNVLLALANRLLAVIKRGDSVLLTVSIFVIGVILVKVFCDHSNINDRVFKPHNWFPVHNKTLKKVLQSGRGKSYALHDRKLSGDKVETMDECDQKNKKEVTPKTKKKSETFYVMSLWAVAHVLFYAILGFTVPRLWPAFIGTSFAWEIIEMQVSDCHCMLDPIWNMVGMTLGMGLHKLVYKSF